MDLSKHLEKADEAARRKNYGLAIGLYQQILDLDPGYAAARRGLREALNGKFHGKKASGGALTMIQGVLPLLSAKIAGMTKGYASQAKNLERFLAMAPQNVGASMSLAQALEKGGWAESAMVVFEHVGNCVMAQGKGSSQTAIGAEGFRRAGLLAQGLGKLSEAMDYYEKALKLNPRDQDAIRARKNLAAEGALQETGFDQAGHSRELIKDKGKHAELERSQRIHRSEEELSEDLATLEKQLKAKPEDEVLAAKVADLLHKAGRVEDALEQYEALLRKKPGDYRLTVKVGELRTHDLEKQLDKARKLEDDDEIRILEERLTRLKLDETRKRAELHPTEMGIRQELGSLYMDLADWDAAIAEFQKSVKDPRHKLDALIELGRAFKNKDMGDLARSQFEKALAEVGPGDNRYMALCYEMGLLAEAMGDAPAAKENFTKILEHDIGYKDVADRLKQLEA